MAKTNNENVSKIITNIIEEGKKNVSDVLELKDVLGFYKHMVDKIVPVGEKKEMVNDPKILVSMIKDFYDDFYDVVKMFEGENIMEEGERALKDLPSDVSEMKFRNAIANLKRFVDDAEGFLKGKWEMPEVLDEEDMEILYRASLDLPIEYVEYANNRMSDIEDITFSTQSITVIKEALNFLEKKKISSDMNVNDIINKFKNKKNEKSNKLGKP